MNNKYLPMQEITVKNLDCDKNTTANVLKYSKKTNNNPHVSVVIPIFNVEAFLPQCLDSLLNQTMKDFEIIAVDDGSTDSSLDILMKYADKDERITVISQNNNYAGIARNAGISVASGKYIIFLDGDDFFEKDMLEEASYVLDNEKSDLVFFQYKYFNVETNKDEALARGINKKNDEGKKYLTVNTSSLGEQLFTFANPMPWNKMMNLDFVKRNNLLFQGLLLSNDVYFSFTSLLSSKRVSLLYKPLVHYRYNNSNSLRNKRDENPFCFYECFNKLHDYIIKTHKYTDTVKIAFLNSFVSSILFTIENTFYKKNEVKLFAKHTILPLLFKNQEDYALIKEAYYQKLKNYGLTDLTMPEAVISLTTYPARIGTICQTLATIVSQNYPYKCIVLYLADSQFPNKEKDLPKDLVEMIEHNTVLIRWCHDIRSYKKLLPCLKQFNHEAVITADDDLLYPTDWLQRLILAYKEHPNYIHTLRAHGIVINSLFTVQPYLKWVNSMKSSEPSFFNFLTGGAGCLYPPNSLSTKVFNEKFIKKNCPIADDIWFWANAVIKGTPINLVTPTIGNLKYVPGTQDANETLWKKNVLENQNDKQLQAVLDKYPEIFEKLIMEYTQARTKKYVFNSFLITKGFGEKCYYKNIKLLNINIYSTLQSKNCKLTQFMGFKIKRVRNI